MQLDPLARERLALGYGDSRDPEFALNALTARIDPDRVEGLPPAPKVTLYAQPGAEARLDLARVAAWLTTTVSTYAPAPDNKFVPYRKRGIVDGVLAVNERGNGEQLRRYLAVRRMGSIEYGVECARTISTYSDQFWILHLQLIVMQFWQLLFFIDALSTEFSVASPWVVWCNARSVKPVVLVGFGNRWAEPFRDAADITYPLEDNFQIEQHFAGGENAHATTVREFATRFDFAFGATKARAYDYPGDEDAALTFGRLSYS
jgi:hypothetical protein